MLSVYTDFDWNPDLNYSLNCSLIQAQSFDFKDQETRWKNQGLNMANLF